MFVKNATSAQWLFRGILLLQLVMLLVTFKIGNPTYVQVTLGIGALISGLLIAYRLGSGSREELKKMSDGAKETESMLTAVSEQWSRYSSDGRPAQFASRPGASERDIINSLQSLSALSVCALIAICVAVLPFWAVLQNGASASQILKLGLLAGLEWLMLTALVAGLTLRLKFIKNS